MRMAFLLLGIVAFCCYGTVAPTTIVLSECEPPDFPARGGYGPRRTFYFPGDQIHYFCETDTYIGGNYLRVCEDTGDWSGHTPVCDEAAEFASFNQTSTANHPAENGPDRAIDGDRSTCSKTNGGRKSHWMGMLKTPGEVFRVMLFLPREEVNYEVFMLKRNGQKLSCGKKEGYHDRLVWEFHNCPGPNNRDGVGIQIKALSDEPLELCEVVAHTLTDPTCTDPHVRIDHGRLELTRKTASLVCDPFYTKSSDTQLKCVRTGVWNRKNLNCLETD